MEQASETHQSGDATGASNLYQQVLDADPGNVMALFGKASAAFDLGKVADAKQLAQQVLNVEPSAARARQVVARCDMAEGNLDAALSGLVQAHAMDPDDRQLADEMVGALRRRYWTYNPQEHEQLLEEAQAGKLLAGNLPRLMHQSFAKLIRPQLLQLIATGTSDDREDESIFEAYRALMDEDTSKDFDVLATNLRSIVQAFMQQPAYSERAARLTQRDGAEVDTLSLADVDPMTQGSIEFITHGGEMQFVPLAEIQSLELGEPFLAIPAKIALRSGQSFDGFVPALYALTEFCNDQELNSGRKAILRGLTPQFHVPLGVRLFRTTEGIQPIVNYTRVEIREIPQPGS